MTLKSSQPIGIFDSGVGGLTVAHAVTQLLPQEDIVYFGDVAHHPYGEKSTAAIQAYVIKICDMLLQQQCKVILIACNSASSAAFELVKEYVASKAHVVNVIDPAVDHLREHFSHKRIGLIGTRQTVNSNIYKKKVDALDLDIDLHALATPLLAPMIEEGYANHPILIQTLNNYLAQTELNHIDALLLACTHYPIIKKQIAAYYQHNVTLIDNAEITASAVKGLLDHHQLRNQQTCSPHYKFYASDYTEAFFANASLFFPDAIHFEHYPLWE